MGWGRGYPILDWYGDETINLNPSDMGYGYENMLENRGKGLRRQYLYPSAPLSCLDQQQQKKEKRS